MPRARRTSSPSVLEPYPWDYLLGSVHWIDGARGRPASRALGADARSRRSGRRYSRELEAAARSGRSTSLAHPDLVEDLRRPCSSWNWRAGDRRAATASRSRSRPPGCTSRSASSIRTPSCCGSARQPDHARLGRARRPTTSAATSTARSSYARAAGYETVTVFDGRRVAPGAARVSDYRVGIGVDAHALEEGVPARPRRRRVPVPARARGTLGR